MGDGLADRSGGSRGGGDARGRAAELPRWHRRHRIQFVALVLGLWLFVYLVLAFAQWGSAGSCHWAFPKWFGCVLSAHEGLAGGLVGASGALIAARIAWMAVQEQINAEHDRMMADRVEADEHPDAETIERVRDATAYMAQRVSRPESIANYQGMVEILAWDRRIKYNVLINGFEKLRAFIDPASKWEPDEVLDAIRELGDDFEVCLPATSDYFEGLWRRTPKAMSFADIVRWLGPGAPDN